MMTDRTAAYRARAAMNRARARAHQRALRRLADLHVEEFAILLAEERETEGLPPLGTTVSVAPKYGRAS